MNKEYSKLIIYFFSGTGNAKNTALWIIDEAEKLGFNTELYDVSISNKQKRNKPDDNALVGFISPTHGFHFPKIMRKFIKQFPKTINCNAFIANTRAGTRIGKKTLVGLSGVLHYWSSFILIKKGFKIVGLFPVDLPSNWISIHPAFREAGTKILYNNAEHKVRRFARIIINGGRSYRALYDILQDVLISPVSILYNLFGKYFFSKSFIASSQCIHCNLCITSCPVGAIKEINGRKYWTAKCESCMKCMNECPQQAIETAHGFILLIFCINSSFSWYSLKLIQKIPALDGYQWLQDNRTQFCIKSFLVFLFLFAGYRLLHWLMQFKLFERLFVLTSLTKYKFWGRYNAFIKKDKHSKSFY